MGEMVPKDPDANGFIDNEAIRELAEKITNALRPIGLTVFEDQYAFAIHPEHGMVVQIAALVRPSAKEKMDTDKADREAFNIMMAKQAEDSQDDKVNQIKAMFESDNYTDLMMGDAELEPTCEHKRRHQSGHCLDCGDGLGG